MAANLHPVAEQCADRRSAEAVAEELAGWGERSASFVVTSDMKHNIAVAHDRLLGHLEGSTTRIYGVHSGFGSNVDSARDPKSWRANQAELLQYLQVGVGDPLPSAVVRRALRLQALKLAKGYSGVHPETFRRLVILSGAPELPRVPCYGSLGASGDLVPMAHAVAPVFAEDGPRGPRDVIGLVNTNAMMSSLALECLVDVRSLWRLSCGITAATSLGLGATFEPFDPEVLELNELQTGIARAGAAICRARGELEQRLGLAPVSAGTIQERYSVRCAPQILGNLAENLEFATTRIVAEAVSVADNPLVLRGGMWHGGLFYASGLATAADLMADAAGRLAEMVDRQVLLLVGVDTSHGLPENLASPGYCHVKGVHQLLSALNQSLRASAVPSRLLSFSCEGNNQDVVPCAMAALLRVRESLGIARQALGAAAFCAERAVHLRHALPLPAHLNLSAWNEYEPQRLSG
jgi:histidine ammonia-lyase